MPAQLALANLVKELETDDYRTVSGVSARITTAFAEAKALLILHEALTAERPKGRDG
jgi:hypothetical protein